MSEPVTMHIGATPAEAAMEAASDIARCIREAVDARSKCTLAVSGGESARTLLAALATQDVTWHAVHLFQVDERIAPADDPARNLHDLKIELLERVMLPMSNVHPMPVELSSPRMAAEIYAQLLHEHAGEQAGLDVVHLGVGGDGHTASLVPDDTLLDEQSLDVGVSRRYQGYRRLTLTYPCLHRARKIVWFVSGAGKADALRRLLRADPTIPAGRVNRNHAVIYADRTALG